MKLYQVVHYHQSMIVPEGPYWDNEVEALHSAQIRQRDCEERHEINYLYGVITLEVPVRWADEAANG